MPFINDKLKSYQSVNLNHEERLDEKYPYKASKISKMKTRFTFSPENVMHQLTRSIYGQHSMIEKVSDMMYVVHADITEKDRPLYVAMFLGPTGVGKTETVRVIAESIIGEKEGFSRIDMNTLAQEHYAAAMTGAPPGYVGSKEGHTVFNEEKIEGSFSKPGIVLFDEIEKADQSVTQSLLNVFDNGQMVLANGEKTLDFRNSMIFMTSNIGSRQIFEFAEDHFKAKWKRLLYRMNPTYWGKDENYVLQKIIHKQLEKQFPPEFINRIDDIIIFNWLGGEALEPMIDKITDELNKRLEKHHCRVELDDQTKEFLIKKGFDKQYGARAIKRLVRQYVEIPLGKVLREEEYTGQIVTYKAFVESNKITFKK
ncbi:AAA family ATPase [Bacillus sp. FJAT-44742]|uniref:AAA family ATPase n=1 Tax=Bacillus sp. FJAT-44742 TaxID=2014005 RepID=UPI000C24A2DA|nr:AAA family ATPase [Bacillus sp. FJAT-44742]